MASPIAVAVRAGAVVSIYGAVVAAVNARTLPRLRAEPVTEPVTVVVPARNEADRIAGLVADLRAQTLLGTLRVIVLDDDSTDETAEVSTRAFGGDSRFALVRNTQAPEPGWVGKTAACRRAAEHAARLVDRRGPGVLVFLDADVRLTSDALAAGVTELRRTRADLVSAWPRQDSGTGVERLIQPLLCWSWFATLPMMLANRTTRPSMAVACGQILVFDAAAYYRIGGHAAAADSFTEDLDMARALRRRGGRSVVAAAQDRITCRMYHGPGPLRAGYARWLWSAFGSPAGSAAVTAGAALTYLVPPVAMLIGRGRTRGWGAAGYIAATASRLIARAVESGRRPSPRDVLDAAAHPASIVGLIGLTAASHRDRRLGRLRWKDRVLG
ncbi:glycosyltransferase family 2 protein [Rhodococcus sp. ABRD24]|uniref:glycosyltransferase family 2 protein n=1 Tax=Rhodococcus sp. ABRD24 TaxID=2507582 RepID=UPI001F602D3C|nr:glycosyltransferase family 2 protein [Rhodococcus sp. ABRD24]